jgi:hypothetical protein
MRGLLIGLLETYRRLSRWWLKVRGKTPADVAEARIVSGKAWEDYCNTLKAAGAALSFPGAPQDPFSQAEGYRYLTRLARAGLEAFIEHADSGAPVLHRVVHETVKMGADNPDNFYSTARISGTRQYKISGRRNTIHYIGFGTQIGHYGQGRGMPPTGYLEGSEIEIDEDGRFEILLSCDQPETGNWLPMTSETGTLLVRQTFLDRENETPADLEIEAVGEATVPGRVTPALIDDGLRSASTIVAGASMLFAKWARDFQKHTNALPQFDPDVSRNAGGDPNIVYYHSHWRLAEDEALVVEVVPPECEHWNFQLNNYWMESLDYRYHRIHLNKHSAQHENDGSIRIVVAHRDPGHPNWIETVGHTQGTMCFRWVRAAEHPQPSTRVVRLADLTGRSQSQAPSP